MRQKSLSIARSHSLEIAEGTEVRTNDHLERPSHRRKRLNQYLRGDRIGRGRHGEVYMCQDTLNDHREVAMKIVKRSNPKDKIKLLRRNYQQTGGSTKHALNSTENSVRKEIAVMKRCRHPNLATLFEVIDDPREEKMYLVMEYLSGGALEWTNADNRPLLTLAQIRRILRDVILGVEFMHSKGILHRDIKPSNIVYTAKRSSVKLIDFGISHIMVPPSPMRASLDSADPCNELWELFPPSDLAKRIGTPSFLAPEVVWFSDDSDTTATSYDSSSSTSLRDDPSGTVVNHVFLMAKVRPPITPAIDIWSLGVTIFCLLFGRTPFNGSSSVNDSVHHNEFMLYHQICTQDWSPDDFMGAEQAPTGGRHPGDKLSDGFLVIQLLDGMLQKHPKHRASLSQVKNNPFILRDVLDAKTWLRVTTPSSSEKSPCWIKTFARRFVDLLVKRG